MEPLVSHYRAKLLKYLVILTKKYNSDSVCSYKKERRAPIRIKQLQY